MQSAWAFYNSLGQIIGGFEGAWKFYNASGEVQSTFEGGGGGGLFEPLTNGDVSDPELIFANGDVIMVEIP